jgi:hypothetical protein
MGWDIKDFVLEQVKNRGQDLMYASDELKDDIEVVITALNSDRRAIKYTSERLKDNKEVIKNILNQEGLLIKYASKRLRSDKELGLLAVQKNPLAFQYLGGSLKNDKDVVLTTLKKKDADYKLLDFIPQRMFSDKEILDILIKKKLEVLKYAPEELRNDPELAIKSISQNYSNLKYVNKELRDNESFMDKVLKLQKPNSFLNNHLKTFYSPRLKLEEKNRNNFSVKIGDKTIFFVDIPTKKEILFFKTVLFKAIMKINNSKVPSFSKALKNLDIVFGESGEADKLFSENSKKTTPNVQAQYFSTRDEIIYYTNTIGSGRDVYMTIIHEIAHRLHYLHIKNGFENKELKDLYNKTTSQVMCRLSQFPKIGDPLSDLNVNEKNEWELVTRKASAEFYLKEITDDGIFIYKDSLGKEIKFPRNKIMKMIRCPSEYGAENVMEFFAEMCTMITLGIVKPNQEMIAKIFINIVEKNLI